MVYDLVHWPVVGATAGAILAGVINFAVARRQAMADRVLDFHKEFNSAEMINARNKGGDYVSRNPTKKIIYIVDDPGDSEGAKNFRIIVGFFERFAICVNRGLLGVGVSRDLFGEVFIWWYIVAFENAMKGSGWQVEFEFDRCYRKIKKNTQDQVKMARWMASAMRYRTEYTINR